MTLVAFVGVGAGSTASAQLADLTCPFTITTTFSPGVSAIAKAQQIAGTARAGTRVSSATPCSSVSGVVYQGGEADVVGSGTLGCTPLSPTGLAGSAGGTLPIRWNNGEVSTISWEVTYASIVPVANVKVTSGALAGAFMLVAPVPTGLTGSCLTPVTHLTFAGVVTLLRL